MILANYRASSTRSSLALYKASASNLKPKALIQIQTTKHILSHSPMNSNWEGTEIIENFRECLYDIPTDLEESEDLGAAENSVFDCETNCQ